MNDILEPLTIGSCKAVDVLDLIFEPPVRGSGTMALSSRTPVWEATRDGEPSGVGVGPCGRPRPYGRPLEVRPAGPTNPRGPENKSDEEKHVTLAELGGWEVGCRPFPPLLSNDYQDPPRASCRRPTRGGARGPSKPERAVPYFLQCSGAVAGKASHPAARSQ